MIQQFMILTFGSLANSTPYLGGFLLAIVLAWIAAARSLDTQFTSLQKMEAENEEDNVDDAVTDVAKVNGSLGNGSLNGRSASANGSAAEPVVVDISPPSAAPPLAQ